jgi:hypothetical protein
MSQSLRRSAVRDLIVALCLVGFVVACLLAACVTPGSTTLYIHNQSGKGITSVYFRDKGDAAWDAERLSWASPSHRIEPGERFPFYSIDQGDLEIRLVFEDGIEQIYSKQIPGASPVAELYVL